jgi:LmbE family N-acetylglucosaminyl deacetylase
MSFARLPHTSPTAAELVDRIGVDAPTVLAVWAHPDDESMLGAGVMAEIARRGGRVVNVTATLGEHGTDDPDQHPPARLAERRRGELGSALERLGCGEYRILGLEDGRCDQVTDRMGARLVATVLEDVMPDLVLGFGPDGVTGHPDHRALARWTAEAVRTCGGTVPLLTTAAGSAWPHDVVERLHTVEAFWPGFPDRRVATDLHLRLEPDDVETKVAAMACHHSQIGPVADALGPDGLRRLAASEAYTAANPAARALTGRAATAA